MFSNYYYFHVVLFHYWLHSTSLLSIRFFFFRFSLLAYLCHLSSSFIRLFSPRTSYELVLLSFFCLFYAFVVFSVSVFSRLVVFYIVICFLVVFILLLYSPSFWCFLDFLVFCYFLVLFFQFFLGIIRLPSFSLRAALLVL